MKRFKEMKKNQKGFTLVELIVVLVILAILAAMLVPALLGYIDRAKEGKYEEEVHAIYTAIQVVYDEAYAKGTTMTGTITGDALTEVNDMVEPTDVKTITGITVKDNSDDKGKYIVTGFTCTFDSQDGTTTGLTGKLDKGMVEVKK